MKRIPDIITEPKTTHKGNINDNIIPISDIITKNKHKIKYHRSTL